MGSSEMQWYVHTAISNHGDKKHDMRVKTLD